MEMEQIIKALECCTRGRKSKTDRPCLECPYNECNIVGGTSERQISGTCQGWLMKDALALIKQQDEQIFQLENRLKECENGYAGTLHIESCKLHDAEEKVKELTEENERLKNENEAYSELEQGCLVTGVKKLRADTVREIFGNIYSSLDYIEEQMDPDEIPECFFSVREDIDALKVTYEGEGDPDG